MESARLDSWKEIASFLHRDARTVRRWERERRLPVHRVPGGERSGVFAYVTELESWLHAASPAPETAGSAKPGIPVRAEAANDVNETEIDDIAEGHSLHDVVEESAPVLIPEPLPASAFRSLNSMETAFAVKPLDESLSNFHPAGERVIALSRFLSYQGISIALVMVVAIGVLAAVVHYTGRRSVVAAVHRPSPEAQELYLRGRYYWNLRTEASLVTAVDLFTQSIVNDPQYAEAYAGLADSYLLLRQYGNMPNSEAYPRALGAARQAIALDDSSPGAHLSLAFVLKFWNWDMTAAEKEYRRAIELNPNDSLSHHWYATALLSSNRYSEALTEIDIARRLEPQSVSVLADRGLILSMMDPEAGVVALKQVEEAQPGFTSAHTYLAGTYLRVEDYKDFLAESTEAAELSHDTAMMTLLQSAQRTLAARGPKPMLHQLADGIAPLTDRGTVAAYNTARLFGLAGEPGQAMRYLRLAHDHREPGFLNVDDDAAFAQLRNLGEYNALLGRRHPVGEAGTQVMARSSTPEVPDPVAGRERR